MLLLIGRRKTSHQKQAHLQPIKFRSEGLSQNATPATGSNVQAKVEPPVAACHQSAENDCAEHEYGLKGELKICLGLPGDGSEVEPLQRGPVHALRRQDHSGLPLLRQRWLRESNSP